MGIEEFVTGLDFGEGPRWREGCLWYSDFYQKAVFSVDDTGAREMVVRLEDQPSGLGWLPDGSLLIVSMCERKVLRYDGNRATVHADLSNIAGFDCNDMVVSEAGHAYVGNHGFDVVSLGTAGAKPAKLAHVTPSGNATVAADGLLFPNGSVITPDGETLIVGESMGRRYTAFTINNDGSLSDTETWADLGDHAPDGCALDAEGGIWFASPLHIEGPSVRRVERGGATTNVISVEEPVWACMLGGADGHTLFLLSAPGFAPGEVAGRGLGKIWTVLVDHPHAGLP